MKIICFAIFLLITTFINAKDLGAPSKDIKICLSFTDIAKAAALAHQNRVPITEMYKIILDQKDKDMQSLMRVAIDSAYRTRLADSEEEKNEIILEYTNQIFVDCMNTMGKNE